MRTAETNPVYQSQILPIMQRAETQIKELVLVAFLYAQPKALLLGAILQVINRVKAEIPKEFGDVSAYTKGLVASADRMVREGYNKPQLAYNLAKNSLLSTAPSPINITTPKQLFDLTSNVRDLWAEAKGSPNVTDYPKVLKQTINKLTEMPVTTYEEGKRPISIWQKAELDTRYEHQMKMLDDLKEQGEDLCFISSHPDCSKRCQPWQGKLVSLSKRSTMTGFRVGKVDGHWCYSLTDIMAQVDKYGYHNNIICGFNCRHRLIPYRTGRYAPTKYTDKEVAKERNIEISIREQERKIRLNKTKERLYNKSGIVPPRVRTIKGGKIVEVTLKEHIQTQVAAYKRFCERNGYAWMEYRIKI